MKICVGSFRYVAVRRQRVWCKAIVCNTFWNPSSRSAILRFFKRLDILYPCLPCPWVISLGGINEPSV